MGPKSGPKKLVYTAGGGIKEGFKAITSLGGFDEPTAKRNAKGAPAECPLRSRVLQSLIAQ